MRLQLVSDLKISVVFFCAENRTCWQPIGYDQFEGITVLTRRLHFIYSVFNVKAKLNNFVLSRKPRLNSLFVC